MALKTGRSRIMSPENWDHQILRLHNNATALVNVVDINAYEKATVNSKIVFDRVHRQTPIRVHLCGVTILCIR